MDSGWKKGRSREKVKGLGKKEGSEKKQRRRPKREDERKGSGPHRNLPVPCFLLPVLPVLVFPQRLVGLVEVPLRQPQSSGGRGRTRRDGRRPVSTEDEREGVVLLLLVVALGGTHGVPDYGAEGGEGEGVSKGRRRKGKKRREEQESWTYTFHPYSPRFRGTAFLRSGFPCLQREGANGVSLD